MQRHLKERLLGVSVLVAIVVIVVPMVFDGESLPARSGLDRSYSSSMPSSRLVLMDDSSIQPIAPVSSDRNRSQAAKLPALEAVPPEPVAVAEKPERISVTAQDEVTEEMEDNPMFPIDYSPAGPEAGLHTAPYHAADRISGLQTAVVSPPDETDAVSSPPDETETHGELSVPTVEKKGNWVVQVGSFAKRSNAELLNRQLLQLGYSAFVEQTEEGERGLWRVRVGPHVSRLDAEALLSRLKQQKGVQDDAIVLGYP